MKKLSHLSVLAALITALSSVHATTVIPPTFDQLVDQAELIFQGTVTDVRSQWVGEGSQRQIVSYVTFKVEDAIKGSPGESYAIRMLGGTVGDETMGVSDAPKFNLGDKNILFVENNGSQFVPLVGIMHGRFRIERDQSGQEVVMSNDGEPVKNVARLGKDVAAPSAGATLTPAAFKAAVQSKLQSAQPGRSEQ
ncbi:MAG: hypothetical protein M3R29_07490 [Verrucomicrobiota bacterium]|nr:hypothetical protein [Verrucomicrobiota bacterium]